MPRSIAGARICIITTGHLATTPRMTKAADALSAAGASVHVVSATSTDWAVRADDDVMRRRQGAWSWSSIDYRRNKGKGWVASGIRQRAAMAAAVVVPPERLPLTIAACARERVYRELAREAGRVPADLYYGGGVAMATTHAVAREANVPFALDLEDFHPADQTRDARGRTVERLSRRIESEVLRDAGGLTGGSEEIARAYEREFGVEVMPVSNTFLLHEPHERPDPDRGPLRLYWFSQTVGPGRGIEDAIRAAGVSGERMELHLQGSVTPAYRDLLIGLAASAAPRLQVNFHEPCMPDDVVLECARYDVGLALESSDIPNRALCLTNKALAYTAAGIAVALTNTPGQHRLATDLGTGALVVREGEIDALAAGLKLWATNRSALARSHAATRGAAKQRWNWEHANEGPLLVSTIARALGGKA